MRFGLLKKIGKKKSPTKNYAVLSMLDEIKIRFHGKPHNLPLEDIAKGCIGALLVFDTYEEAKSWGGENAVLLELER